MSSTLVQSVVRSFARPAISKGPSVVVAPTTQALSLAEVKLQCKQSTDDTIEDAWFEGAIVAAERFAEAAYSFSIMARTLRTTLDAFPAAEFVRLPAGPVSQILSVKYYDDENVEQTYDSDPLTKVFLDDSEQVDRAVLLPSADWPVASLRSVAAVQVAYTAGAATPQAVPADVKHALKMLIAHWYANREEVVIAPGMTVAPVPLGADSILGMQVRRP